MKMLILSLALIAGQMITHQEKPVVHLKPHADIIELFMNASVLELDHSPDVVHLPAPAPLPDPQGNQWTVDVRNFGPATVEVWGPSNFKLQVPVNQTVHIYSTGKVYLQKFN